MIGMRMVVDLAPPVAGVDVGDVAAFGHVAAVGKRRRDKPQAKLHSSVSLWRPYRFEIRIRNLRCSFI